MVLAFIWHPGFSNPRSCLVTVTVLQKLLGLFGHFCVFYAFEALQRGVGTNPSDPNAN